MSNAPGKPVSFSRPKVGYFSNRPRIHCTSAFLYYLPMRSSKWPFLQDISSPKPLHAFYAPLRVARPSLPALITTVHTSTKHETRTSVLFCNSSFVCLSSQCLPCNFILKSPLRRTFPRQKRPFQHMNKAEEYSYLLTTDITCKYFTNFILKKLTHVNYELHSTGSAHVLRLAPRSRPTQSGPMSINRHQIDM